MSANSESSRTIHRSQAAKAENVDFVPLLHKLLLLGLLLPVSLTIGADGTSPLDFVIPDIFVIGWVFLILTRRYPISTHLIILLFFFVSIISICLNASTDGLLNQRLISFFRLFRSFPLIYIGYDIAMRFNHEKILDIFTKFSALIVVTLVISDFVFQPGFPASRWGGKFLTFDTYGFPNSPAAFYSVFALFCADKLMNREGTFFSKLLFGISLIGIALIITMTLSRSGLGNFALLMILLFFVASNRKILLFFTGLAVTILAYKIFQYIPDLYSAFAFKVDRTLNSNDFASGRTELWDVALDLIYQRPIFGYGYQSFSNFSQYGTPHNQYLEMLYKSGLVGASAFFGILAFFVWIGLSSRNILNKQYACLLLSWSATSLFQPNFSYTPTLNFTMFVAGMMIADRWRSRVRRSAGLGV